MRESIQRLRKASNEYHRAMQARYDELMREQKIMTDDLAVHHLVVAQIELERDATVVDSLEGPHDISLGPAVICDNKVWTRANAGERAAGNRGTHGWIERYELDP